MRWVAFDAQPMDWHTRLNLAVYVQDDEGGREARGVVLPGRVQKEFPLVEAVGPAEAAAALRKVADWLDGLAESAPAMPQRNTEPNSSGGS